MLKSTSYFSRENRFSAIRHYIWSVYEEMDISTCQSELIIFIAIVSIN